MSPELHRPSGKDQLAKNRGLIRGPEVPKTSFRNIASKMASRVFSLAQTPARPPGLPSIPLVRSPGVNRSSAFASPVTAPTHSDSLTPPEVEECVSVAAITPSLMGFNPITLSSFKPTSKADL